MTGALTPWLPLDEGAPIQAWADCSLRVCGTRTHLELVLEEHFAGMDCARLAERFPDMSRADAEAILAYYYRHRPEIDAYLAWIRERGDANEARARQRHGLSLAPGG